MELLLIKICGGVFLRSLKMVYTRLLISTLKIIFKHKRFKLVLLQRILFTHFEAKIITVKTFV